MNHRLTHLRSYLRQKCLEEHQLFHLPPFRIQLVNYLCHHPWNTQEDSLWVTFAGVRCRFVHCLRLPLRVDNILWKRSTDSRVNTGGRKPESLIPRYTGGQLKYKAIDRLEHYHTMIRNENWYFSLVRSIKIAWFLVSVESVVSSPNTIQEGYPSFG